MRRALTQRGGIAVPVTLDTPETASTALMMMNASQTLRVTPMQIVSTRMVLSPASVTPDTMAMGFPARKAVCPTTTATPMRIIVPAVLVCQKPMMASRARMTSNASVIIVVTLDRARPKLITRVLASVITSVTAFTVIPLQARATLLLLEATALRVAIVPAVIATTKTTFARCILTISDVEITPSVPATTATQRQPSARMTLALNPRALHVLTCRRPARGVWIRLVRSSALTLRSTTCKRALSSTPRLPAAPCRAAAAMPTVTPLNTAILLPPALRNSLTETNAQATPCARQHSVMTPVLQLFVLRTLALLPTVALVPTHRMRALGARMIWAQSFAITR
eukprot:Rmarinus@m.18971